ncbi:MAG: hypothetical protein HN802_02765 [Candidatus Jacksonbacteria bacterium]|mgnify:CR=1 FL=1|jgi:ATP-dependent exoDNAse (exonuclease V) beta subunit|nr:hypothetical protein [Candidatus Jacksonbacteria bacterium]
MNKLNDPNIWLEPENHRYILRDDPEFEFLSSTRFIHSFFEPFDREAIAAKLLKMPKYAGFTKEDLFHEWSQSAVIGTKIHEEMEEYIKNKTDPKHKKSISGVEWLNTNIPTTCKLYSEVIVYSKELRIAGMIDLLVHNPDTDSYTIVDWKSNKKIHERAYKKKTGTKAATTNIEDCNFNHYSLQLSLYKYIIEKEYGIKVKNLYLAHLKEDSVESYSCLYMKRTLLDMLSE